MESRKTRTSGPDDTAPSAAVITNVKEVPKLNGAQGGYDLEVEFMVGDTGPFHKRIASGITKKEEILKEVKEYIATIREIYSLTSS